MLIQLDHAAIPPALLGALADQLRLPTGFADDAAAEPLLSRCLAFAIAFVEGRSGRALVQRRFRVVTREWDAGGRCRLPIAPVVALDGLAVVDAHAERTAYDPTLFRIDTYVSPPILLARPPVALPAIPEDGVAEIDLTAGYGPGWEDAPVDLREAVILMAAASYEDPRLDAPTPLGVLRLLEPYRQVRL